MRNNRVPEWAESYISWDTCDIAQYEAKRLVEEGEYDDEDDAFNAACGDSDLYDMEWDYTCDWLTELMETVAKGNIYWRAVVNNFGWQHRDGYKNFKAEDGKGLLREVLPNTDCTFYIYLSKDKKQIVINNAHHDAPMGGEMYYIEADPGDDDDN